MVGYGCVIPHAEIYANGYQIYTRGCVHAYLGTYFSHRHISTWARKHGCTNTSTQGNIRAHKGTYTHVGTYIHISHIGPYPREHIHTYAQTQIHKGIKAHTRAHTHTDTKSRSSGPQRPPTCRYGRAGMSPQGSRWTRLPAAEGRTQLSHAQRQGRGRWARAGRRDGRYNIAFLRCSPSVLPRLRGHVLERKKTLIHFAGEVYVKLEKLALR